MQKLTLRTIIHTLMRELNTDVILGKLGPPQPIPTHELQNIIVESKSAYDKLSLNEARKAVLVTSGGAPSYDNRSYTRILNHLSNPRNEVTTSLLANSKELSALYNFHQSLWVTANLIDGFLFPDKELFDGSSDVTDDDLSAKGILMLEIVDEGDISLERLNKVLNSIKHVIDILYLFFEKVEHHNIERTSKVVLVDSGTDINISIKLPEDVTRKLSEILGEFWEMIASYKLFRHKKKGEVIAESISILKQIQVAKGKGVLSPEQAEDWARSIVEDTETIVLNRALPKAILNQTTEISNRNLLLNQARNLLLTEGNSKDGDAAQE